MTSPSFTTYSTSRLIQVMRLDRHLDVVLQVPVLRVGDIADAQQLLDLLPALVGHRNRARLLVHHKVAGVGLVLQRLDQLARLPASE